MSSSIHTEPEQAILSPGLFHQKPLLLKATISIVFLLGIVIRLHSINEPGVVSDRQYRSFLIARAYYFELSDAVPAWRKEVANTSSQRQEALEPQITERVVALFYWLGDGERTWIPRLVSSLFWLIGGIPLFMLARRIESVDSAVFSTAYYLLVPFGVLMSLSFLPEPLMIMMLLFSLLTIIRYYEQPSIRTLLLTTVVSGLAILVKPFVVFVIVGAFVAIAISKKGGIKRLIDSHLLVFGILSVLPSAIYYGYGILGPGYLRWKVETSFLPHFLLTRAYWEGWFQSAVEAVGFAPLIIALLGIPMLRKGMSSALLIGMGVGYVAFCLFFNYFTYFLAYYHAQLIVIVALAIGPLLSLATAQLRRLCNRWYSWAPAFFAILCIVLFDVRAVQKGHVYPTIEGKEIAAEIGDLVNHSNRVAYLAQVYGLPLEYDGELAGEYWPRPTKGWPLQKANDQPLSIEERITRLGFSPEYFVITQFEEYNRHHSDLKSFLEEKGSLVAENEHYIIYKFPTDT